MMNHLQLVQFERGLRNERVLSVYIHGAAEDPAERFAWRRNLDRSLRELRRGIASSSHGERETFDRSVARLEGLLAPYLTGVPCRGWAAFIGDGVAYSAEKLPVPTPTVATWDMGICIAPYMRAIKATQPVIVAIVDARVARVYRFHLGSLEPVTTIRAHAIIGTPAHMGDTPRAGFHPGVRGETARDVAQRAHAVGTERMLREAALVVTARASGPIIVGGIPRIASQFRESLGASTLHQILHLESLGAHATEAEIVELADAGASALRDAADLRAISGIIDAHGHDRVALGLDATRGALDARAVRELYVTPRFIEGQLAAADAAVRSALDQGATVETVARAVAAQLDAHGGVAARLRFRAPDRASA